MQVVLYVSDLLLSGVGPAHQTAEKFWVIPNISVVGAEAEVLVDCGVKMHALVVVLDIFLVVVLVMDLVELVKVFYVQHFYVKLLQISFIQILLVGRI